MHSSGCAMAPNRSNWSKLGMRHVLDLPRIVTDRKTEIGRAWHYDSSCSNGLQGGSKIFLIECVGANVSMLPRPQHSQQVIRIPSPEVAFEEPHGILKGCQADLAVLLFTKEILREKPARKY